MTDLQWDKLINYVRTSVTSKFDSSIIVSDHNFNIPVNHIGFFISIELANGDIVFRDGFLKANLTDIKSSSDIVINNIKSVLTAKNIKLSEIQGSTFYFTSVINQSYMADPLSWNENVDGVYFQWGQDYRGYYLPYEIRKMNIPKIEIMDRLCSHQCNLVTNLWRLPEGLCFKLICESKTA